MRDLASPPEGIADQVISGFGNAVYVSTSGSRLLKIDLPAGTVIEMSPEVPVATAVGGVSVAGALMDFALSGAAPADASPELIKGDSAPQPPIVAASGSQISVQVPWEAPAGASLSITFPRKSWSVRVGASRLRYLAGRTFFLHRTCVTLFTNSRPSRLQRSGD